MDLLSAGHPRSTKSAFLAALLLFIVPLPAGHGQTVKFTFGADSLPYKPAAEWYQQQWDADGPRIIRAMEAASGMRFRNLQIRAIVYLGISYTGTDSLPMHLNVRYPFGMTLVHELGHRLNAQIRDRPAELDDHRLLYLYLYDTWIALYGKRFADAAVEAEKGWASQGLVFIVSAWDWALSMTPEQRRQQLAELVKRQKSPPPNPALQLTRP